nr:signal peptidase II [Aliicoccus persicus]
MPIGLMTLGIIGLDQLTKQLVKRNMEIGESIEVFGEYLKITSHRNEGAAWGIMQGQMVFFYIVTAVVLAAMTYIYYKEAKGKPMLQIGIGFLVAGAIGNLIDRVIYQRVIDFVDVLIINYSFPIFNVADAALTVGVATLIIYFLFFDKEEKKGELNADN